MTIAYTKDLKDYAQRIKGFGFKIVGIDEAAYYDALIYKHKESNNLLASIHPLKEILFLDVTNITPENAAAILESGLYSPIF